MGLKREISLLRWEKGLKDLYYIIDMCVFGMYLMKGLPEGARWHYACKRLNDALVNVVKHSSDNG